jgi:hypothetical protein
VGFGILDSWRSGANQDAANEALKTGNPVQLGPLERLYGGTVEDAQNIVDTANQKALNRQYSGAAVAAGLTPFKSGFADFGEGEASLATRIKTAQELKDKKTAAETRAIEKGIREESYAETAKTLAAQLQAQQQNNAATLAQQSAQHNATLTSQQNQFAHTSKQNRLDRRHQTELADSKEGLQMQMAIMQNDLSEKRMDYDRETRRMDKRSQAIAQLMSGLGSLGGAFSL